MYQCVAGLDVHRRQVTCHVISAAADGRFQAETRHYPVFRKDLAEMAGWLAEHKVERAVMESTGIYWQPVYEALDSTGVPSWVVNARHAKQVPGRKTDVKDAEWLAELGLYGLVRPSFMPPPELRDIRSMARYRKRLVSCVCSEKNRLHKLLDSRGIRLGVVASDINGVSARRMIDALIEGRKTPSEIAEMAVGTMRKKREELRLALDGDLSEDNRRLLQLIQDHIRWLNQQVAWLDDHIVDSLGSYRESWRLLQTIPGYDQISAAQVVCEIGDAIGHFQNAHHLASWVGLCPGSHESAGKKKTGKTRKGNKYLRSVLCEVAHSASRTHCQFKGFFENVLTRRGKKRAIMATAHKILKVTYAVLKKKEPYKDPQIDYEELAVRRRAPRWIKALKKYGYLPTQAA